MATPLAIIVALMSFLVLVAAFAFAVAGGPGIYFCVLAGAGALAGVLLSLRGFVQHTTVEPVVAVSASMFALLLNAAVLVGAVLLALALTNLAL